MRHVKPQAKHTKQQRNGAPGLMAGRFLDATLTSKFPHPLGERARLATWRRLGRENAQPDQSDP